MKIPLSHGQRRLWAIHNLEGPSPTYNIVLGLRLHGDIDKLILQEALNDVIARHQSLRTVFPECDGEPYQSIVGKADARLALGVVQTSTPAVVAREYARLPFDLYGELPIRACIIEITPHDSILVAVVHHIAADGWSLSPMARDLAAFYVSRSLKTSPNLKPLPVQYADYTMWQRDLLGDAEDPDSLLARELCYWREQLRGIANRTRIPSSVQRPEHPSFHGSSVPITVDAVVYSELRKLAGRHGVTAFMVIHACLAATLTIAGAGDDIPIGTPVAGRTDSALDDLIGFFVNTIVLRVRTDGNPTFDELVDRIGRVDIDAFAHQEVPFDAVLDSVRGSADEALFDVMLVLQNAPTARLDLPEIGLMPESIPLGVAKFDISIDLSTVASSEDAVGLVGTMEYATDVFDSGWAQGFVQQFEDVLTACSLDPKQRILDVRRRPDNGAALEPAVHQYVSREIPETWSISEAIRAADHGRIALTDGERAISYGELNLSADGLAEEVRGLGVRPGDVVGLWMPRGIDAVISMLAIWRVGAAYLPLDPSYPKRRIELMCADAKPGAILTVQALRPSVPNTDAVVLEIDNSSEKSVRRSGIGGGSGSSAAYVVYTSGSTGRPKGVLVGQDGLLNQVRWLGRSVGVRSDDTVLARTSISFDAAVTELWMPLYHGARIAIASDDAARDPALLADFIRKNGVSLAQFVPALLALLEPVELSGLRVVMCGGEPLPTQVAAAVANLGPVVFNLYGPTETTVQSVAGRWEQNDLSENTVPIGIPVDNTFVYVLDDQLEVVPNGSTGELYICGIQLAYGYLGQPAATAERFVADPNGTGTRMYRTGDLVRRCADGRLTYIGRADEQVKIRGYRIELGDVSSALRRCSDVKDAIAVAHDDHTGVRRLIGYVTEDNVVRSTQNSCGRILAEVGSYLPQHMIPASVIAMREWPLLPNGKVDRRALPEPDFTSPAPQIPETVASGRAGLIAGLAGEVLGRVDVNLDSDFFELGGDSILAIQWVNRARRTGLTFTTADVFTLRTPRRIAAAVRTGVSIGESRTVAFGLIRPTPIMAELYAANTEIAEFHQSLRIRVPDAVNADVVRPVLQALVNAHDMLRARLIRVVDGSWQLMVPEPGLSVDCRIEEYRDFAGLLAAASKAVSSLDPYNGVMFRVLCAPGSVVLIVHHLVVDGVSWRILATDFSAAVQAVIAGRPVDVQPAPVSFRTWCLWLASQATTDRYQSERSYWQHVLSTPQPPLRQDASTSTSRMPACSINQSVDTETVKVLSEYLPRTLRAGMQEALLACLAIAVSRFRSESGVAESRLLLDLESHGRADYGPDVSRTVGWFTSLAPICLDVDSARWSTLCAEPVRVAAAVQRVKDQIRSIPGHGLGYGILRYLNPPGSESLSGKRPLICFNYLGRVGAPTTDGSWSVDTDFEIPGADAGRPATHGLCIDVLLTNPEEPEIASVWRWDPSLCNEIDVVTLAEYWREAIDLLARGIGQTGVPSLAVSDLAFAGLPEHELKILSERHTELVDVLPCTPLQEAMIAHSELDRSEADAYVVQVELRLKGELDPGRLRDAVEAVTLRNNALRSAVHWCQSGVPVIAVVAEVITDLHVADLRPLPEEETQREAELFVRQHGQSRFDLATPGLSRWGLIAESRNQWRLVLTNHHLILDGWSVPILLAEISAEYTEPGQAVDERPQPQQVLSWLAQQDTGQAKRAWASALRGIDLPTLVAPDDTAMVPASHLVKSLSDSLTGALTASARTIGVTLNTCVQLAWASVLASMTNRTDVVFGTVVSGRPAEVPSSDLMVGMLINTVPVRVQFDPTASLSETAVAFQHQQAQLLPHHHLGLADITGCTELPALFDTILIFENYPAGTTDMRMGGAIVETVHIRDGSHYPLSLLIAPGRQLTIRLDHRPDLFDEEDAESLLEAFLKTIDSFVKNPSELAASVLESKSPPVHRVSKTKNGGPIRVPRDARDRIILSLFGEMLGHPVAGIDVDFFEAGGNSLLAAQLSRRITSALDLKVSLRMIYDCRTVAALADLLGSSRGESDLAPVLTLRSLGSGAPLFCLHPGMGIGWSYVGLLSHLDPARPLYVLQSRSISKPDDAPRSMEDAVIGYADLVVSLQSQGPYHLLGWSFGGVAAHAVAVELQRRGHRVGTLTLLDAYPPVELPHLTEDQHRSGIVAELAVALGAPLPTPGQSLEQDLAELAAAAGDPEIAHTLGSVMEAATINNRILRAHSPGRFDGNALFFTASREPVNSAEYWGKFISGTIHVHPVDAKHIDMGTESVLSTVAAKLNRINSELTESE